MSPWDIGPIMGYINASLNLLAITTLFVLYRRIRAAADQMRDDLTAWRKQYHTPARSTWPPEIR